MNDQSFILNLPSDITTDIVIRLPIKTIVTCKCVCKNWLKLISTHHFSKSHLLKSNPGLVVNITQARKHLCRTFQFEDAIGTQPHDLHYKPLIKFDPDTLSNSKIKIRAFHSNPVYNNYRKPSIWIESSVNGLICLRGYNTELDTLFICNPIMRECITLPGLGGIFELPNIVTYGFGISASSSQYKVVRISHKPVEFSGTYPLTSVKLECMIYTVGTRVWRSVQLDDECKNSLGPYNGVFLNGNLHWWTGDENGSLYIPCFDLETERFKPFASPPCFPYKQTVLTVLDEYLCVCEYGLDEEIVIWFLNDYGVEESWMKKFVICKSDELDGAFYKIVTPLQVFGNGDILMMLEHTCLLYHCKEKGTNPKIDMFERDYYGGIYALLYTPSFISLRSFELENVSSF